MFASGVAIAILLGLSGPNWTLVFIVIALAGFGIGGQQLVLNYLIAEAYPTQLRATATGWSIGIGRLGSARPWGMFCSPAWASPATSCRWRFRWRLPR
jgi:MFS transporter, AAHS family, 4-hydroxybenzoate transporter